MHRYHQPHPPATRFLSSQVVTVLTVRLPRSALTVCVIAWLAWILGVLGLGYTSHVFVCLIEWRTMATVQSKIEHAQARHTGSGNADTERIEWLAEQRRDTTASFLLHAPRTMYIATVRNESLARTRYDLLRRLPNPFAPPRLSTNLPPPPLPSQPPPSSSSSSSSSSSLKP